MKIWRSVASAAYVFWCIVDFDDDIIVNNAGLWFIVSQLLYLVCMVILMNSQELDVAIVFGKSLDSLYNAVTRNSLHVDFQK